MPSLSLFSLSLSLSEISSRTVAKNIQNFTDHSFIFQSYHLSSSAHLAIMIHVIVHNYRTTKPRLFRSALAPSSFSREKTCLDVVFLSTSNSFHIPACTCPD
jgi:hypothetical protein